MAATREPKIVHAIPGRVRVHLPGWGGREPHDIETQLRCVKGVISARPNPLTGNVLIHFDPAETDGGTILRAMRALGTDTLSAQEREEKSLPSAIRERRGGRGRARITVRGLDRDPQLGPRVVDRLQSLTGVQQVSANALTGRVLVEFDEHRIDLEELISEVGGMELPPLLGEDRPAHPLDPKPLIDSALRLVGASLGLGLVAAQRLARVQTPTLGGAAEAVGVINILEGMPATRNGLRTFLGRYTTDILFTGTELLALTLSSSPLGLALTAAGALRLLTEVRARRAAFQRYEERISGVASAQPGAVIRLESGHRTPLAAEVVEGAGTAAGEDGLPVPICPGRAVGAGARLHGGPFVLELKVGRSFTPGVRPAPVTKSLYESYMQTVGRLSLGYAALTALFTGSLSRSFTALLLVSPRTALIGRQAADASASARVLRSGVTIVGTRPNQVVRLPSTLLLYSPRVLTDGFEVSSIMPLGEDQNASEILDWAAAVAAASGSPWGNAFPSTDGKGATEGNFDGEAATADIGDTRYSLHPVEDWESLPAARRIRNQGEYPLLLSREGERRPLGICALRPRLASGVADMLQVCRRRGVEVDLIPAGDPIVAQAIAQRTEIGLLPDEDAVGAVRARQERGEVVALVSDSARAAEAFEACDMAIGLSSGHSSRFPARADLLASDLATVAAIVETSARWGAAVRDSVAVSAGSNVFGAAWGLRGEPNVEQASYAIYVAALSTLAIGWVWLRGRGLDGSTHA
ncbi:MAG: hypothetical protein JOZ19_05810 [Rubrobacter sp.]|nr:hypothetical protein [Rubrobacter sp.]